MKKNRFGSRGVSSRIVQHVSSATVNFLTACATLLNASPAFTSPPFHQLNYKITKQLKNFFFLSFDLAEARKKKKNMTRDRWLCSSNNSVIKYKLFNVFLCLHQFCALRSTRFLFFFPRNFHFHNFSTIFCSAISWRTQKFMKI